MRTGFTVSATAHVALIAIAIVGIGMGRPMDAVPVESIAVDLVPITEFTNIRMGSLDSEIVETETPSPVKDEVRPEIAQPTGNTQEDQPTPADNEKVTPAPTENTAPAPEAAPEPAPEPEPEAAPPEPAARPEPAPEPEPAQEPEPTPEPTPVVTPEVTPDPAESAPKPFTRTASLDQKRAEFKKQQEAQKEKQAEEKAATEVKKKADEEKKKKAAADEKKRIEQAKADAAAKAADEIDNIINAEASRGATTGQGGEPTLGKEDGRSATLSQSEMGALSAAMLACFSPPMGAAEEEAGAVVEVQLSQNGMVQGQPRVLSVTGATTGQMTGSAAVRAVLRCGQNGYTMLPQEKYAGDNGWNTVKVTFNARDVF